jgi:hypothetical protein
MASLPAAWLAGFDILAAHSLCPLPTPTETMATDDVDTNNERERGENGIFIQQEYNYRCVLATN